jgi:ZIP family zinc transporter
MLEAVAWGTLAASALLLGAIVALVVRVPERLLGLVLAFGAGVLMSAVAYELVEEAASTASHTVLVATGFAAGAIVFFVGSLVVSERDVGGGARRPRMRGRRTRSQGIQIVLGAVLDGIPESVVLGASLVSGAGVSVAMLAAVFISNVPEAIGASADLRADGWSPRRVLALWLVVVAVSALAAGLGYALLADAAPDLGAFAQTFAAGAIIAMLAESMIPEAYEKGGRAVGLATALGFAVSALLSFNS